MSIDDTLATMLRSLAVVTACLVVCAATAEADTVAVNVRQLGSEGTYKVRLAAAISLAKTRDARAVKAIASALQRDDDATIRRFAALALADMVNSQTPDEARDLAITALESAAGADPDLRVRETAARALKPLAALRRPRAKRDRPAVFIKLDPVADQSKQLPNGAGDRIDKLLKRRVESTGYATSWPGGLPTQAELASSRSRAFIVASTVKKIEVTQLNGQTQIACTVAVRVAPWNGRDGGERWEANRAASASGSAKAMTGNRARDVEGGMRDCIEAVAEDVAARQVVPFLKRVAAAKP